jgi:hypothetical protein
MPKSPILIKASNRDLLTDSTSGISVMLAAGELDPRDVLREINGNLFGKRLNSREQAYLEAVKRQLIMREFARSALEVQSYRFAPGALGADSAEYQRLLEGDTGIPLVDACLVDLKAGLPHNRARLLLARFAIRNLNLDPSLVAKFFAKHLTDYCPVINTFNTVSAASAANFGEPCYRSSNPVTAAKKLDPSGEYTTAFGFDGAESTAAGLNSIRDGNTLWQIRWKAARENHNFIRHPLWPLKDKERGIYFILDRIAARGAFAPYYRHYLQRENELLSA